MRGREIERAVRNFSRAIDAYGRLERDLEEVRRSLDDLALRFPALGRTGALVDRFERIEQDLEVIGVAVAEVPGLASELGLERERFLRIKELVERQGLVVRLDRV
jgi:hypothetical protein